MNSGNNLDEFLKKQSKRVHSSDRGLANLVRDAYPIGVPALIMKSSTDRMMISSGYSFILGTPDEHFRSLASWLITEAGNTHRTLLKLIKRLWKRHGREDVALAAILLSNIDLKGMGTNPWKVLVDSIHPVEPVDSLLLNIEEIFRAKRQPPSEEMMLQWIEGRKVEQHLALIVAYSGKIHGHYFSDEIIRKISLIEIPPGDSILARIIDKLNEN
jgi:hypothetical protein